LQDRKQSNQLTADSPSTHFAGAATVDESPSVDTSQTVPESRSVDTSPASLEHLTLNLNGFVLVERALVNSRILPYVRMVASVLECRTIRREELIAALLKSMRQRSMAAAPRREYVLRYLNEHPP
jgi:hypothetical protein